MPLAAGTRLGPYEIDAPLGAGGMGEVYRARDTRLGRTIAIKVLPADRAQESDARARFDREARAIAALNHPNICALFDVGHDQGHDYLVMELLEGETLLRRLGRGAFDVPDLVDIGMTLADALDTAHAHGLIHRDLKPANIFLTSRGHVKILDFGLAKALVDPAHDVTCRAEEALTGLGMTLGTIAYMSPEQLRGEPLDQRTDLFSLGLVLYEMATGQRAFGGSTTAVVSAAILGQEPQPPRALRADLPVRLDDIILKTLEKDRALRCQSAAELRADLSRLKRESGSRSAGAVPVVRDPSAMTVAGHVPGPAPSQTADSPRLETTVAPSPNRSRTRIALGVAVVLAVALVAYFAGREGSHVRSPGNSTENSRGFSPESQGRRGPPPPPSTGPDPFRRGGPPPDEVRADGRLMRGVPPPDGAGRDGRMRGASPQDEGRDSGPSRGAAVAGVGSAAVPDTTVETSARASGGRGGRGAATPAAVSLIALLRTLPPQTYELVVRAGDMAARARAGQLRGALDNAGWTCSRMSAVGVLPDEIGILVPRMSPATTALANWARRNGMNPDYRVVPRLAETRIIIGTGR